MTAGDTVLVTGAGGFIGNHVVRTLESAGTTVVAVPHRWKSIRELAAQVPPDGVNACIHLGWYADPRTYLRALGPNVASMTSTVELAQWLGGIGCEAMVVAGSVAEYAPASAPLEESSTVSPTSTYGAAKAFCHELLRTTARPDSMAVTWARLFYVVGPGDHDSKVLSLAAAALVRGETIELSPGTQVRDYIDVRDVATALVKLVATRHDDAVNVCSGTATTLRRMIELVAQHTGNARVLQFGAREFGPAEDHYVVGRNALLQTLTGWQPALTPERTAADIAAWWHARQAEGQQ